MNQTIFIKKCIAMFVISLLSKFAWGQQTFGIKGEITDSSGAKVDGGVVVLLNPTDSAILKGAPFWDGKFELLGIEWRDVVLRVTAIGYQEVQQKRHLEPNSDGMVDLGKIMLSVASNNLKTVEVVYKIPMFEREPGKLIVNIEGTILSDKGTLIDVLKSAPNVIVKSNGEVSVAGKGAAIIYLDGQRVNSLDMLSGISSRDIKRVDVIENPSAKYDAEGNAVIEIITRKGVMNGYQGNAYINASKRTYEQLMYGGNVNFRKDWFSGYFACAQQIGTFREEEDYYRQIKDVNLVEMENKVGTDIDHDFDAGILLKTDYRLDSINTLFFNYNAIAHNYSTRVVNTNNITENKIFSGNINSNTNGTLDWGLNSVSSGYQRLFDTSGSKIKVTGQFTKFNFGNNSSIDQISDFGTPLERLFKNESFNHIKVINGQVDYSKHLKSKLKWESGIKSSFVTNGSAIKFQYLEQDIWKVDSSLFNDFDYKENILAGYSEISGAAKKLEYTLGLRYEWTQINGSSFLAGQGVVDRKYQNLFPSLQVNYKVSPDLILGASYNNRINRPSYQDLDPFINFIDSLSSIRGNPQLLPSYSHATELSLVYMEYASLKIGYTKTKNPIFLTLEQNVGTNTFSAITRNIESSEMYSFGIVLPYELSWWTTFNSFGYTINSFAYKNDSKVVANKKPSFYVNLYNEFRIPKVFNLELTYEYVSPGSQGIFIMKPYQSFGVSLARKFYNDKFSIRLSAFDLFYRQIESGESQFGNLFVDYSSKADTKQFMIAINYNFGRLKETDLTGSNIDADERSRIKQ